MNPFYIYRKLKLKERGNSGGVQLQLPKVSGRGETQLAPEGGIPSRRQGSTQTSQLRLQIICPPLPQGVSGSSKASATDQTPSSHPLHLFLPSAVLKGSMHPAWLSWCHRPRCAKLQTAGARRRRGAGELGWDLNPGLVLSLPRDLSAQLGHIHQGAQRTFAGVCTRGTDSEHLPSRYAGVQRSPPLLGYL